MNCYTVTPGRVKPGIATTDGLILVGEEGRGRKLVRVPVPHGSTIDSDVLTDAPLRDEGDALLLVEDQSGFRGDWALYAPRSEQGYEQFVARQHAHRYNRGQDAVAEGHDTWHEGAKCPACAAMPLEPRLPAQWRVIAEGRCAQGDAGAMGGGPQYLLVLPAGTALQINRGGRLYGEPDILLVRNEAGVVTVSDPLADADSRMAATSGAW